MFTIVRKSRLASLLKRFAETEDYRRELETLADRTLDAEDKVTKLEKQVHIMSRRMVDRQEELGACRSKIKELEGSLRAVQTTIDDALSHMPEVSDAFFLERCTRHSRCARPDGHEDSLGCVDEDGSDVLPACIRPSYGALE